MRLKTARNVLRCIGYAALPLMAAMPGGCASSNQGSLKMVSLDHRHDFTQSFNQAYICRTQSGDADIVLLQDPSPRPSGRGVQPSPDLHQLVHIRVFWTPLPCGEADHPANTNASLHWCLVGGNPASGNLVEYSGCGLVIISNDDPNGSAVTIQTAWMKPISEHGVMVDPLGPSMLRGTIHAVNDATKVAALLQEMKVATASATEPPAAMANEPQPKRMTVVNP